MKTKNNFLILLISSVLLVSTSCKKNDTGGKAEIHALIYHGENPVKASTLYVKFNATSQPSNPTEEYDLKVQGEEDDNHVHVEDLRPGDYYLYAVGFDSLSNKVVKGGAATRISWGEHKKLKEVTIQLSY